MDKEKILAMMNEKSGGFNKHNGIKVTDIGEGSCVVEAELCDEALNPMGNAHGGFVYSLCDVASGIASAMSGKPGVTLSGNIYFLHASKGAKLRCEGKVIKNGGSIVVAETCVFDETGLMTAKGSFEMFVSKTKEKK